MIELKDYAAPSSSDEEEKWAKDLALVGKWTVLRVGAIAHDDPPRLCTLLLRPAESGTRALVRVARIVAAVLVEGDIISCSIMDYPNDNEPLVSRFLDISLVESKA